MKKTASILHAVKAGGRLRCGQGHNDLGQGSDYDRHIDAIMVQNDVLDTAKMEGHAEGFEKGVMKGITETARRMKQHGIAPDLIATMTGLSKEDVEAL